MVYFIFLCIFFFFFFPERCKGRVVLLTLGNLTQKGHTGKRTAHLVVVGELQNTHPYILATFAAQETSLSFSKKPYLQTWCGMSHIIYYVYMKEGELKGTCQHIVIALGIDPSPPMWHVILPMTTGLGYPRLCIFCTSCMGQSWGHTEPGQWQVIPQQRWGPWQHCPPTAWFSITQCQVWGKKYDQNPPQAPSMHSLFFLY